MRPILRAQNITHRFESFTSVKNISIEMRPGEFVSLVGPSGSGKSVLVKILSGLLRPTDGIIQTNFKSDSNPTKIAVAFQDALLFPWLTVEKNIEICLNHPEWTPNQKKEITEKFLELTRLQPFKDFYPSEISGGMKQKVNVLRCFCSDAEVILMDEPFSALDFLQKSELQQFTQEIWSAQKKTILFVTHDIDEAIFLSDRILIMSPSPGTILNELTVPFQRFRQLEEIRALPEYLDIFKEIKRRFREQVTS